MAELSKEQMEEMAATMRLPAEQRSIGQVGALMDLVAGQRFFQSLSYKLAQQVCRHLRPQQVDAGDYVFQEGEDGWEFYVMLRGTVEVIIGGDTVATMGVGTTFGELALIDGDAGNSKRTASIRCATDCFLGVVGKDVYNKLIKKEQEAALSVVTEFYSKNQYMQDMRADTILHMAHVSQTKRWAKGDVMMATGEEVDGLLFLISGQCMISKEVYLAPDSTIRGSTAASLANSGHPGLRQELKKICVDISLVCGYGDVVGESELLKELLRELASKEGRKRGLVDKADKDKGETSLTRVFTVRAVTDVEAYHVKPRDANRFFARSQAAREGLVRNQERRDTIFEQRMAQWEATREMQHGSPRKSQVMGSGSAKPAARAVLAPFPESSALHRNRSDRRSNGASNVGKSNARTLLSMGSMHSGGGASAVAMPSQMLPPVVRASELPARARSTPPSHSHSADSGGLPVRSSSVLRSKRSAGSTQARWAGDDLGSTSGSRTRNALWAPKYSVTHQIDITKKPTVAFGRQGRRFPVSAEDKQKEREGEHGGDIHDQIVWKATRGLSTQLRRPSSSLDSWFEEVAYINSDGVLCS
eukprot:COSAG02_NODE_450_length_22075_cov_13.896888_6_plen_588_part_00